MNQMSAVGVAKYDTVNTVQKQTPFNQLDTAVAYAATVVGELEDAARALVGRLDQECAPLCSTESPAPSGLIPGVAMQADQINGLCSRVRSVISAMRRVS